MYVANLDVDVVDVGVPVLSMHAPFEVVSKSTFIWPSAPLKPSSAWNKLATFYRLKRAHKTKSRVSERFRKQHFSAPLSAGGRPRQRPQNLVA